MSNQFLKLRRSAIPGKIPETSSLDLGELAMNTHDGLLFMKKSSSFGEEIIPIGVSTTSGSFTGSFSGSFSGSFRGDITYPGIQQGSGSGHVLMYNTGSGNFFYTASSAIGEVGGIQFIQDNTPTGTGTASIKPGVMWLKTDSGLLYIYYSDGDSYQWVEQTLPTATGATGPSGPNNIDTSTTTPINGVLKGNGSTVAQAVAGTDYQAPIGYTPENQANKENTTLDNSSTKYPTNNLVKTNIDNFSDDVDYVIMINQRILFNF
jgi:hypothetical protein